MRKPLSVGITIGLRSASESLWTNGIKQNAIFLAEALRRCPNVREVLIVNTTPIEVTDEFPWDLVRWPTLSFSDAKDRVDVLIELGGQIDVNATAYLKKRGARIVSYCCGVEYIQAMESIIFNRPLFGDNLFVNQRYDDIWMVPQVASSSQPYFEVLRRQAAKIVPFVWSPIFLEQQSELLQKGGIYRPSIGKKRLAIMEPNIDVVKFCLYPIFLAELAYRDFPEGIEKLYVTNAEGIATSSLEFISIMHQLDIVRDGKAMFLGRHDTPSFLSENIDIVISHQTDNPLNYFYLEVCWQGFPLLHNASLCRDLGYYYINNQLTEGASLIRKIIDVHDLGHVDYLAHQRRLIGRYLPTSQPLINAYTVLLDQLNTRELR